uniref:Uncharacterized protein n=1 Tax=viral metagenome TaxID=1070528 RepID=A0A6C0DAL1_9ZZZZ
MATDFFNYIYLLCYKFFIFLSCKTKYEEEEEVVNIMIR